MRERTLNRHIDNISRFVTMQWRRGACVVAFVMLPVGLAFAQGTVSGRVVLLEKPGSKTTDLDNAVIWLEPAPGAQVHARAAKVELAMQARQFAPHVRVVPVGSTVSFPNKDPFSHNIFSSTPGTSFDLGKYSRGESKDWVFSKPGAISVYCNVHAKMTAFVVVVATPWYAEAAADGRWSIAGVPAGKYTIHIWHERASEQKMPVTVPAAGFEVAEAQLDARGYVVAPHKDMLGGDYTGPGQIKY
jgi:plastocyanin